MSDTGFESRREAKRINYSQNFYNWNTRKDNWRREVNQNLDMRSSTEQSVAVRTFFTGGEKELQFMRIALLARQQLIRGIQHF